MAVEQLSRMKRLLGAVLGGCWLCCAGLPAAEPWSDERLPVREGLELWLDCARQIPARTTLQLPPLADRNRMDYLLDGSGHARHLEQKSPEARPRFHTDGQGAFLEFDGRDDALTVSHLRVEMTKATVFIVAAARSNAGGFRGYFSLNRVGGNDYSTGLNLDLGPSATTELSYLNVEGSGGAGAGQLLQGSLMAFGAWHVFTLETQPGAQSVRLVVDGRSQRARDRGISVIRLDEFVLGARHYSNSGGVPFTQGFFDGDIAEFLLYSRALTSAESRSVERYLGQKYSSWLPSSAALAVQTDLPATGGDSVAAKAPLEPAPLEIRGEPRPRKRAEIETLLGAAGAANKPAGASAPPFNIILCAGPKDHGPGEHDYPLWQKRWAKLLALDDKVKVDTAWEWPLAEQWQAANVIVFYSDNPGWNSARAAELGAYLSRGGGAVFVHYAVDGHEEVEALAKLIGLAWRGGFSKYRHGPVDLKLEPGPLTGGLTKPHFVDESYWNLVGSLDGGQLVASAVEEGEPQPLIWTRLQGKGRVCVNILGHYTWTFDDPLFRILLLRGICWAGAQPIDRLTPLALPGARLTD